MRHLLLRIALLGLLAPASAMAHLAAGASSDAPEIRLGRNLERWSLRGGHGYLRPDATLSAVALENSQALAEISGEAPSGMTEFLHFLLSQRRVRDAVVMAFATRFIDWPTLEQRLRAFLEERAPGGELSHYGVGVVPSSRVATVILVRRRVEVVSVHARPGEPLEICGRVLSGKRPRVLVTYPAGEVLERGPYPGEATRSARRAPESGEATRSARRASTRSRFCVRLGRADPGKHQVEIMVDGPLGPEVAALFPLYVGVEEPKLPVGKLYPPERQQRSEVEARLLKLINRTRREAGLGPLTPSTELTRVARRQSADMMEGAFFGHRSPRRGGLAQRLAAEHIDYLSASENLALTTGPQRAHDALMGSPAHRRNILDPGATHVGIGASVDRMRGLIHVTECFARLPE